VAATWAARLEAARIGNASEHKDDSTSSDAQQQAVPSNETSSSTTTAAPDDGTATSSAAAKEPTTNTSDSGEKPSTTSPRSPTSVIQSVSDSDDDDDDSDSESTSPRVSLNTSYLKSSGESDNPNATAVGATTTSSPTEAPSATTDDKPNEAATNAPANVYATGLATEPTAAAATPTPSTAAATTAASAPVADAPTSVYATNLREEAPSNAYATSLSADSSSSSSSNAASSAYSGFVTAPVYSEAEFGAVVEADNAYTDVELLDKATHSAAYATSLTAIKPKPESNDVVSHGDNRATADDTTATTAAAAETNEPSTTQSGELVTIDPGSLTHKVWNADTWAANGLATVRAQEKLFKTLSNELRPKLAAILAPDSTADELQLPLLWEQLFTTLSPQHKLEKLREIVSPSDTPTLPTVPARWMDLYREAQSKGLMHTVLSRALHMSDHTANATAGPWMTALALILSSSEQADVRGNLLGELVYDCT